MNPGVYIHIPFCQSRCSYCHFTTRPWEPEVAERYRDAVVSEIRAFDPPPTVTGPVATIYFGGGTPSLAPPSHLAALLSTIQGSFGILDGAEITVEANPGTVSPGKAAGYVEMGINRVSLGAQSFDDTELRSLGRVHSSQDVRDSVRILRDAGIANISLDLMLGLPGQTPGGWRRSLSEVANLGPEHISIYMFDVDVSSPLKCAIEAGDCVLPDDDLVADLFEETIDFLGPAGFEHYEISNFARCGYHARHNLKYWMREPVLGFGLSSHSYDGAARYANSEVMATYLECIGRGEAPRVWHRPDEPRTAIGESLFLGLRLTRGVDCGALRERFGAAAFAEFEPGLDRAVGNGLARYTDRRLYLTRRGMLLSNDVFSEFV